MIDKETAEYLLDLDAAPGFILSQLDDFDLEDAMDWLEGLGL